MNTSDKYITNGKGCSLKDGQIIIPFNEHRVRIGNRTAIIKVNNWSNMIEASITHQVFLDFASDTANASEASPEVQTVIARLFPEEAK